MTSHYDQWKLASPPDAAEYDYDKFENLPYRWDVGARRYRDAEGWFVPTRKAESANDAECEKREEAKRDNEDRFWREEY